MSNCKAVISRKRRPFDFAGKIGKDNLLRKNNHPRREEMIRKKINFIFSLFAVTFFLVLGVDLVFGQKDFTLEEKQLFQRFKIANKHFENGKNHFLKEDYKKAERELRQCLDKMPEHSGAYFFYFSNFL